MRKPFKQTYEETQKVEEETSVRDYFYITTIVNNNFTIQEITNEEMQYEGADMLLAKREAPLDGKVYLFIDRKASKKTKRDSFIFELYYQYNNKQKRESWSLREPNTDNITMVAFTDMEQVVMIKRANMINTLRLIEKEAPQLITKTEEVNKYGDEVTKYIVTLSKDDNYFKMMRPSIYDMEKECLLYDMLMKNYRGDK